MTPPAAGHARNLLGKHGQELTEGIVQELEALHRELADLRNELATLRSPTDSVEEIVAPTPVVISAGEHLGPQQGFYPAEQTEAGAPFNWSGPAAQFSFDVSVNRAHGADLKLEAINFLDFDKQSDVKLLVDGLEIPVAVTRDEPGAVITASLPASDNDKTNLTFVLPDALSPETADDERMLGLAFVRLTVTPTE